MDISALDDQIRRDNFFIESGLGLASDKAELKETSDLWFKAFSLEALRIFNTLKISDLKIYHVGSTSIPRFLAKPIVDILIEVPSIQQIDNKEALFQEMGYSFKGEYGIAGRRFCDLYDKEEKVGFVHLHIYETGHPDISGKLRFKHALIKNEDINKRYLHIKNEIINQLKGSREQYSENKADFFNGLEYGSEKDSRIIILGAADGHTNTFKYVKQLFPNDKFIDLNFMKDVSFRYKSKPSESLKELFLEILKYDEIVLATPVYWYAYSHELKAFIDSLSYLLVEENKSVGKSFRNKKLRMVSTGSDSFVPLGYQSSIIQTSIYFGMDYIGLNYCQSDLINKKEVDSANLEF